MEKNDFQTKHRWVKEEHVASAGLQRGPALPRGAKYKVCEWARACCTAQSGVTLPVLDGVTTASKVVVNVDCIDAFS